jgi:hypothetical protein
LQHAIWDLPVGFLVHSLVTGACRKRPVPPSERYAANENRGNIILNLYASPRHGGAWRSNMAAIARALSRAFTKTSGIHLETLQHLALFCGAGLLVSLLLLNYGLLDFGYL